MLNLNVLLVTDREDKTTYEAVINAAPRTNLLGSVTNIKENFVAEIKEKYHPHIIVWVSGVKLSDEKDELETIADIRNAYDYIRIIYFTGEKKYSEVNAKLNDIGIYDIIDRNITNLEFNNLLENQLNDKKAEDDFNKYKYKVKKQQQSKKFHFSKMLIIPIVAIIVMAVLIVTVLVLKGNNNSDNDIQDTTEEVTELVTEETSVATEAITAPATASTPTQPATQKPTEKATERVTQAATRPAATAPPTTTPPSINNTNDNNGNTNTDTDTDTNNNGNNNNNSGGETQIINDNPTPASTITDDGQIHFEKTSYTVKVGESFDIYVSGLAAAQGCNWDLTNSSVVKFSSADTTRATLTAKGVGVTTVTATAKSNGAAAQVLVTVEK